MNETQARNRRRGAFFLFLVLALVMMVAAIWQYHQMLVSIYDRAAEDVYRRLFGRGGERRALMPLRVALFASPDLLAPEEQGPHYAQLIHAWERYLQRQDVGFRTLSEIPDAETSDQFDLLILPATSQMSDGQIEAVKEFLRRGKGLLMTWAAGTRDGAGAWRRYSLLHVVGGLEFTGVVAGEDESYARLMLSARSPVSEGLPPGFRVRVRRRDQPVAVLARESRTHAVGYWTEDARPDAPVGLAHGHYFDGRFVWIGCTIASAADEYEHQEAFFTLFRNAIIWAGGQPVASKPLWPKDLTGAFSLSQRIEHPGDINDTVLQLARRHHIPLSTFLSVNLLDSLTAEDWERLRAAGSVALVADREAGERRDRVDGLRRARQRASEKLGREVVGFRSSDGTVDDPLLDDLSRAGFQYVAATDADRLAPYIVRSYRPVPLLTRPRELWLIPEQTVADGADRDGLLDLHDQVRAHGGYAAMSVRPAEMTDDALRAWDALLARVRRERVWIASMDEIAGYGRRWGHIRLATRYVSPTVTRLTVSNTGRESVEDVPIQMDMDRSYRRVEFRPTTLGSPPVIPVAVDETRWRVTIPAMRAGKNYSYNISRYD